MCKIIAIANQKGGVAKTTTTINLGVGLSKVGKRVMLIDADPQGHLTMGLGFPKNLRVTLKTMMENIIMGLEFDPREAILHHEEGIDVIPSNKLLSGMDMSLFTVEDRENGRNQRNVRNLIMELELKKLTKEFQGFKAVDDITLTMSNGVYGLLGVNGAGKTTLMRMLCTLIKPTSGSILCDGKDIFALDGEYRRILGYLPQEFGFYPEFSVHDYLMYIASIKGMRISIARKRVTELLRQVGLAKMQNRKMKKLSGGMKRRAGIAQAMLNNPKILILDEPTAGLDPNERIRFRNLISELSQDRLVLLSTHIVSDIEYIANQVLLMKDGKISHSGTQEEIIQSVPVKVWSCVVANNEVEMWQKQFKVSNMKTLSDGIELRILSEKSPHYNAKEETMTLEDIFLYYFGEKTGDDYDVL